MRDVLFLALIALGTIPVATAILINLDSARMRPNRHPVPTRPWNLRDDWSTS